MGLGTATKGPRPVGRPQEQIRYETDALSDITGGLAELLAHGSTLPTAQGLQSDSDTVYTLL